MTGISDKHEEIKSVAETLFASKPDWIRFYREIFGLRGMVRRLCPTSEEMTQFEQSETYRAVHRMMAELRKRPVANNKDTSKEGDEDTRVITVRIPQSLHDALRIEAYEHRTSMNKLCISKLLQFIDGDNVPAAFEDKKVEAGL